MQAYKRGNRRSHEANSHALDALGIGGAGSRYVFLAKTVNMRGEREVESNVRH